MSSTGGSEKNLLKSSNKVTPVLLYVSIVYAWEANACVEQLLPALMPPSSYGFQGGLSEREKCCSLFANSSSVLGMPRGLRVERGRETDKDNNSESLLSTRSQGQMMCALPLNSARLNAAVVCTGSASKDRILKKKLSHMLEGRNVRSPFPW